MSPKAMSLKVCLLGAVAAFSGSTASADTGADFYKGKSVTYIISAGAGGGYDTYGRLVAEFMQRNLPGSTFIVRNMPGAGHLIGANALYASKPDGLTIGSFSTGLIYNQISKNSKANFDLAKMSWIGKAASEPRVVLIAAQSPVKTFDEFMALAACRTEFKILTYVAFSGVWLCGKRQRASRRPCACSVWPPPPVVASNHLIIPRI